MFLVVFVVTVDVVVDVVVVIIVGPRNPTLKFGQNWVSKSWDTVVVVAVSCLFDVVIAIASAAVVV